MKEFIAALLVALLIAAIVTALVIGLATIVGPKSCDAYTKNIGFPHRWSFWGDCQILIHDNWIPLNNYRVINP